MTKKKPAGQYFTVSPVLQDWVFERTQHKSHPLLEPSFGAGHLLRRFIECDPHYPITCYEIDSTIPPIVHFNAPHQTAHYADFLTQYPHPLDNPKYKTIVGNPPYVKQRGRPNIYIQFVEKCFHLLDSDGGELLFIVPSDFLKLTSAASIITQMSQQGRFTDFLFPHDERLFEGASVDVVVFRYQKDIDYPIPSSQQTAQETVVNGRTKLYRVNNGILTFSELPSAAASAIAAAVAAGAAAEEAQQDAAFAHSKQNSSVEALFDVYVGLVSGRDEIYRTVQHGNIDVLMDKDRCDRFLFAESFPTGHPLVDAYLLSNKRALLERRIRTFTEKNWFEWGAPRNLASIRANWGRPCIYVRNLTRNREVAFLNTVQYFGGGLLCLIPKTEMSEDTIKNVVAYMNTAEFQHDYIYSGRFKIGHKQVCNATI